MIDWVIQARCAGSDPEVFSRVRHEATAKRICWGCPVRVECLDYALERPDLKGVWGAKNPADRRWLRHKRGITMSIPLLPPGLVPIVREVKRSPVEEPRDAYSPRVGPCECGAEDIHAADLCKVCYDRAWRAQQREDSKYRRRAATSSNYRKRAS